MVVLKMAMDHGIHNPSLLTSRLFARVRESHWARHRPTGPLVRPDVAFPVALRHPRRMCLAVPGKLETISGEDPLLRSGRVNFSGVTKEVSLACLPEAQVGDYVLVHVGMAIGRVDEEEARQIFSYLREMNELADLEATANPPASARPAVADAVGRTGAAAHKLEACATDQHREAP